MKKIKELTIGITAFDEEQNIKRLLADLIKQELKGFNLKEILVISDGSSDRTVYRAKSIKNKLIRVVNEKNNLGKEVRLNQIIKESKSETLVLLDADIRIHDKSFIEKLVEPIRNGSADLTSSQIQEVKPRGHIESVIQKGMELKRILNMKIKNGNNVYNCHGTALALSKKLYKKIKFPNNRGGDDMYTYLFCLKIGMKFVFVTDAVCFYRLPKTWLEHQKQSKRYQWSIRYCQKVFGAKFVRREFEIKKSDILKAIAHSIPMFFMSPLLVSHYFIIFLFSMLNLSSIRTIDNTWNIRSTKVGG